MRKALPTLALGMIICGSAAAFQANDFYLKPGDTVVFYGDSITDQRLYTAVTELFVVTRYPRLNVRFVHSGWGGDKVTGGGGGLIDVRLQRDVIAYRPTVMTIMLGMNDGRYANHLPTDDDIYYNGYRHIVEEMKKAAPGVRITAIEPSPFDDVTRPSGAPAPNGYNGVLVQYGNWIKQYANEQKLSFADLNTGVVQMLRKANSTDPSLAQKIIPDRVHPALGGHMVMAEQLLKAWNARSLVSSVTIDAERGKVMGAEFAKITDIKAGDQLSWTELEDALPLPFAQLIASNPDHTVALALQSSDITQALNEETLRLHGLKTGRYVLKIDNQDVGTFTDGQLEQGINLAVLDTPMSKQAMDVDTLTVKHLDVHQARWRTLQVPLQDLGTLHLPQALAALDEEEADVIAKQRAAAQPRPHVFTLVPAA